MAIVITNMAEVTVPDVYEMDTVVSLSPFAHHSCTGFEASLTQLLPGTGQQRRPSCARGQALLARYYSLLSRKIAA